MTTDGTVLAGLVADGIGAPGLERIRSSQVTDSFIAPSGGDFTLPWLCSGRRCSGAAESISMILVRSILLFPTHSMEVSRQWLPTRAFRKAGLATQVAWDFMAAGFAGKTSYPKDLSQREHQRRVLPFFSGIQREAEHASLKRDIVQLRNCCFQVFVFAQQFP